MAKTEPLTPQTNESQDDSTIIQLQGVVKSYGSNVILDGISYEVKRGDVVVVIGPSGSGKSTLLKCLNALEEIGSGEITFRNRSLTDWNHNELRHHIGMVFQQFNLFPHLTVLDNLTLAPRKLLKQRKHESEERARAYLKRVGLEEKSESYPNALSGGQQQRY